MNASVYHEKDGDLSLLKGKTIGIIGYGNQAKAQALNMRDSGLNVIIGTDDDKFKERARNDNFPVHDIATLFVKTDIYFLLVSDQQIGKIFEEKIKPYLKENDTIVFYSGYTITFHEISLPKNVDILLISPRVTGEALRENYLNKKGVFSFIHVHQDATGGAKENLLALSRATGALSRSGLDITFRQQAILNLFFEHTFIHGFLQIMMRSILTLIEKGYPPEAIFVELFLSGEGGYTLDKVIDVGMIKQMNFHSKTSQYGQMSRGIKFRNVAGEIGEIQKEIFHQIENGEFVKEWDHELSKLKLQIMKYFASKVKFAKIESQVRENLGFEKEDFSKEVKFPEKDKLNAHPELNDFVENVKAYYRDL